MIYAQIQRRVIAFTFVLIAWTLFCAVNEVTWDLFDDFGSNYWLGFSAIANAVLTLIFFIVLYGVARHVPEA